MMPPVSAIIAAANRVVECAQRVPHVPPSLLAEVQALRRAIEVQQAHAAAYLDADNNRMVGPRGLAHLSRQECRLMELLVRHAGTCVTHAAMVEHLWGDDLDGGPVTAVNVIRVFISRLRQSIKESGAPLAINRVWAQGYCLERDASGASDTGERNGLE